MVSSSQLTVPNFSTPTLTVPAKAGVDINNARIANSGPASRRACLLGDLVALFIEPRHSVVEENLVDFRLLPADQPVDGDLPFRLVRARTADTPSDLQSLMH